MLVKNDLFQGPLGWLLHRLGGLPLDRDNLGAVVRELVREPRSGEPFLLKLAAEGTREKGEHWKSGFWRIARAAGLPIALAFVDEPTRTGGLAHHHRECSGAADAAAQEPSAAGGPVHPPVAPTGRGAPR